MIVFRSAPAAKIPLYAWAILILCLAAMVWSVLAALGLQQARNYLEGLNYTPEVAVQSITAIHWFPYAWDWDMMKAQALSNAKNQTQDFTTWCKALNNCGAWTKVG